MLFLAVVFSSFLSAEDSFQYISTGTKRAGELDALETSASSFIEVFPYGCISYIFPGVGLALRMNRSSFKIEFDVNTTIATVSSGSISLLYGKNEPYFGIGGGFIIIPSSLLSSLKGKYQTFSTLNCFLGYNFTWGFIDGGVKAISDFGDTNLDLSPIVRCGWKY